MNNLIQVTPEELKEGDRVSVTFEGIVLLGGIHSRLLLSDTLNISADSIQPYQLRHATIHRLPPKARPLEKGERVCFNSTHEPVEVLLVDGDYAALKGYCDGKQDHRWFALIQFLSRPCGTPIQIEGE